MKSFGFGWVAMTIIWMGGFAQLVGMPVAWLRLRETQDWKARPDGVRRIDLLAKFVSRATVVTIVWGIAVSIIAPLGGLPTLTIVLLLFGPPLVFVPLIVLEAEIWRFPKMIDEARLERERKPGSPHNKG